MKSKFLLRLAKTGLLVLAVGISMFAKTPHMRNSAASSTPTLPNDNWSV